jgi:hypothetical protein
MVKKKEKKKRKKKEKGLFTFGLSLFFFFGAYRWASSLLNREVLTALTKQKGFEPGDGMIGEKNYRLWELKKEKKERKKERKMRRERGEYF